MSIDETPEDASPPVGRTAEGGGLRAVLFVAAVTAVAVAAVGFYAVPLPAAGGAALVIALLGLLARDRREPTVRRRLVSSGPAARRRPWPDAGVKIVVEAIDEPCLVVDAGGAVRWFNREAANRVPALRRGSRCRWPFA